MMNPLNALKTLKNIKLRKKTIKKTSPDCYQEDFVNSLAKSITPGKMECNVSLIEDVGGNAKLVSFKLPQRVFFKPGSYISLTLMIDGGRVSRPFSIVSSSRKNGNDSLEIIVKKIEDGFVSDYIFSKLKVDERVIIEVLNGDLSYEPLRDGNKILALAGGSGITPFISLAKTINDNNLPMTLVVIWGNKSDKDVFYYETIKKSESSKVHFIFVFENKSDYIDSLTGFIDKAIISRYIKDKTSIFISGSIGMKNYVFKEIEALNVKGIKIRSEANSLNHIDCSNVKVFNICVIMGTSKKTIKAKSDESLLVAFERAKLFLNNACRGGECGYCRLKVIKGDYHIQKENDFRRHMDIEFKYVHGCVTYPRSDMVIKVNLS